MKDRRLNDVTPEEWDAAFDELYNQDKILKTQETQELDSHYTKLKIQPIHYSMENELDAMQHTIIKYVTRFRDKGGKRDLIAARHTLDLLIKYEYDDANN